MRKEFIGEVVLGDPCRVSCDPCEDGAIRIGDSDLVEEVYDATWKDTVRVTLNGKEIACGRAVYSLGYGYSEYTPLEDDFLSVGETDIIDAIRKHEGEIVTVVVED